MFLEGETQNLTTSNVVLERTPKLITKKTEKQKNCTNSPLSNTKRVQMSKHYDNYVEKMSAIVTFKTHMLFNRF